MESKTLRELVDANLCSIKENAGQLKLVALVPIGEK